MIFLWIGLVVIGFIIYYITSNHIRVDWKSLFKKRLPKKRQFIRFIYILWKTTVLGKTYSAVKFTIDMFNKFNYIIITNIKSYNAVPHLYKDDILDIIDFYEKLKPEEQGKYLLFFDEIFTILQKGTKMNDRILPFLSQLRKRGIIFVTTAQEWRLIPLEFRLYVRFQVSCNMKSLPFTHKAIIFNRINDGTSIKWDDQEQDFVAQNIQTNISKGNKYIIDSYDTYETISTNKNLIK